MSGEHKMYKDKKIQTIHLVKAQEKAVTQHLTLTRTMRSGVVMSRGPWYGSSLDAKEARIARPLNT